MSVPKKLYADLNGVKVHNFTLENKNGMKISVLNFGGIITSLKVPNKNGEIYDIVLGYDDLESYEKQTTYFGAIVGRCCNRIDGSKFTIDKTEYLLNSNENGNQLHGGIMGFDKKIWDAKIDGDNLYLTYLSKDGEEGYPGNLKTTVIYTMTEENELFISFEAVSDKDTVVSLTNHSYFNLNGQNSGSILNHLLKINSDYITPVNENLIPTGELMSVDNTPFDFRKPHTVGERINDDNKQLKIGSGYDHNFLLDTDGVSLVAEVIGDKSNIKMLVFTDCDAIQLYTANFIKGIVGKGDVVYDNRDALCLETQACPNAINCPNFPTTLLRAGEEYSKITIFKF